MPAGHIGGCLKAAAAAGDVASLLVPPSIAKDVTADAQALGMAVIVDGEARDAARSGADGVQTDANSADVSAARQALTRYFNFYNRRRPHSTLDGMTPDTAYFNLSKPPLAAAA